MLALEDLGPRICIMGPSNSGKSTLARAIGQARGLKVVHLDRLRHRPHTDWELRPDDEFTALHYEALAGPLWVIEGNYSRLLPQRLEKATGFILLDIPTTTSLYRYFRRCWLEDDRCGGLKGGRDSVKWGMIRHIAITTRANRRRYHQLFRHIDLPKANLGTSLVVVSALGFTTAGSYALSGLVDWPLTALLVSRGIIGTFIGIALGRLLTPRKNLM